MAEFDWLSVENFQPMENTMDLGHRIEEELVEDRSSDSPVQEEHFILSAIADGADGDDEEQEIIILEEPNANADVPQQLFATVVVIDVPIEVQVAPFNDPNANVLHEVPADGDEVYSIRDSSSTSLSFGDYERVDMDDEVGLPPFVNINMPAAPPQVVDLIEEVPQVAQDGDIVEVVPHAPDSPISLHSDDDESVSDHRVHRVVADWLRWEHIQLRNFLTRPESRNTRRYIRYLRSQIQGMRLQLRMRINQLRRYYGLGG